MDLISQSKSLLGSFSGTLTLCIRVIGFPTVRFVIGKGQLQKQLMK